jgi:DNA invertase Pin-like site-specific DNA recombinase
MNRAGIVMGLEVSRLARNSSDWHRLPELCGLTRTLLLDEDGLYDPSSFNDRLLLGLKGTISEVELHLIRARLRGGLLQKARRGELGGRLPTGLVYGASGQVELDPDRQGPRKPSSPVQVFSADRIGGSTGWSATTRLWACTTKE